MPPRRATRASLAGCGGTVVVMDEHARHHVSSKRSQYLLTAMVAAGSVTLLVILWALTPSPRPDDGVGHERPPGYQDHRLGCWRVPAGAWGMEPLGPDHSIMGLMNRITVHHSGKALDSRSDLTVVRAIDEFHRKSNGWAAVGYHFLIGRDGTLFEGRPLWAQGAHVAKENRHNIGICLLGDFRKEDPSPEQLATLEPLLKDLMYQHRVPVGEVQGHGERGQSECPGKHLADWLKRFREAILVEEGAREGTLSP